MALPSFLQAMFTPQRPGPGQMAWRDRDVGEGSGEISQGDIQEMYWKRGPAAKGHGQQMDSAVRPQEGLGQSGAQEVAEGISKMTGLEPGGMSSITEVMQATPVGDEFGGAPAMGYATPSGIQPTSDPMGGGLDRMLGNSRFGGGMSSSTFGDPTADELGIGGGSGSALGPGYMEGPGRTVFDDTGGPASRFGGPTPDELGIGGGGAGSDLPNMTYYNDYLPIDLGQGDYTGSSGWFPGLGDEDQEGMPDPMPRRDPTTAAANWFGERFSAPTQSTNAFNAPGFQGDVEEGVTIPQLATQTISTDPLARIRALRASQGKEPHWPDWLTNLFARSTTGGPGRGPRVRR